MKTAKPADYAGLTFKGKVIRIGLSIFLAISLLSCAGAKTLPNYWNFK